MSTLQNPDYCSEIAEITLRLKAIQRPFNEQEKAEAIKLKVEIERLIAGFGLVTEDALKGAIVGGGDPRLPKPRHFTRRHLRHEDMRMHKP